MKTKKKVAFVCVHNSCRSQMAESFAKKYGEGLIEVYSAGTQLRPQINQDAVRIMKEMYHIDMEATQKSKLLSDIPVVDYLITMGCNVKCPNLPYQYQTEDWGLKDPSGKEDAEFIKTAQIIEEKVKEFINRIR
ncbi:arsenate reductase [Granulicatella balaenopterae]|uniref:Arsenate reductase n=1 Tax=Granulicatella balaenopterae TaxID=137733 RepID=A0A1H9MCE5_9LACT|nr:arsenate reductase ArsC [Granulicatella balaenopterae]SER21440.1 arsenate reductase [Granulicatella balaenopterae]